MVVWQGITEGGTAVPIQVTEEGRVVAEGQEGPAGPPGPEGPQGPQGPQGEYGPGDDVDLGNISAAGVLEVDTTKGGTNVASFTASGDNSYGIKVIAGGAGSANYYADFRRQDNKSVFRIDGDANVIADGSITAKGDIQAGGLATTATIFVKPDDEAAQIELANSQYGGVVYARDGNGKIKIALNGSDGACEFANYKAGFTSEGELYFTSRGERYRVFVQNNLCYAEEFTRATELREKAEAARAPRPADNVEND